MNQTSLHQNATDYARIETAIRYLEDNFKAQPSLDEIASSVDLSPFHFQRLFKRWAGVTPTQFLHFLTVNYAKERLAAAESVLDASFDAGLSSPGRLHDLFVRLEAVTPGEYKSEGEGLEIRYGFHDTPFGTCLLGVTERGICALHFVEDEAEGLELLRRDWPLATFLEDGSKNKELVKRLFSPERDSTRPFHLHLKGTNFQVQVWQALLRIPEGALVSYGDVATLIGKPSATRAVASAIAKNPVGFLIPCHRVISQVGKLHQYRWGSTRKKAMIGWEAGQQQLMQAM